VDEDGHDLFALAVTEHHPVRVERVGVVDGSRRAMKSRVLRKSNGSQLRG